MLSTLHAWIRCFEILLSVSYLFIVKKWLIRDNKNKITANERRQIIQKNLRNQMGLLVNISKSCLRTTNDNNFDIWCENDNDDNTGDFLKICLW